MKELIDKASQLNDIIKKLEEDPNRNEIYFDTVNDLYFEYCDKIAEKWLDKLSDDVGHNLYFNKLDDGIVLDNVYGDNGKIICDETSIVPFFEENHFFQLY